MASPDEVKSIIARNKELDTIFMPWRDQLQLVGQYIDTRRMDFSTTQQPGDFLNRDVFDSVAPKAAKTCASAILSSLWPQSVKRLRLIAPRSLKETTATKAYYEEITRRLMAVMDDPEGGLQLALDEYMKDSVTFGTAGIEIMPDKKTKVKARAWGVRHMKISEGTDNRVDTIYIELEKPVHWFAKEYGVKNLSSKLQDLFKERKFEDKHKVLIAIEPRLMRSAKKGVGAMEFRSTHIELGTNHVLRESGFTELPIKVGRFSKLLGEDYGRCPAMDALPDVLEANMIWEATTIAIEKSLDPPLGVLDDGKLGGSEIDTSAGALNVFNISGRAGEKNPIFPLFTVGEPQWALKLIEQLGKTISDHFYLDRLLDFNNETRMTLGEANLRNKLRNSTLGSIFTRQIMEVISPTVQRYFNLLLDQGEFGYAADSAEAKADPTVLIIPDEIVKLMTKKQDVYGIEYFTPAMRIMQAEEADGILRSWEFAGMLGKGIPQALDGLDEDVSIRLYSNIVGSPSEINRSQSDIDKIRKAREAAAQEAAQMEQARMATEAMRNAGQSGLLPTAQPAGGSGK